MQTYLSLCGDGEVGAVACDAASLLVEAADDTVETGRVTAVWIECATLTYSKATSKQAKQANTKQHKMEIE